MASGLNELRSGTEPSERLLGPEVCVTLASPSGLLGDAHLFLGEIKETSPGIKVPGLSGLRSET